MINPRKYLKKPKKAVVTIHGFGMNRSLHFNDFRKFIEPKGYKVIQFNIYDINNPEDADYKEWIKRCEKQLTTTLDLYDEVILLGFSMGGVIASYLASVYPVKQLILIAPAFNYLDLSTSVHYEKKAIKKIGKKTDSPSGAQTKAFTEIVSQYKESVYYVDCPILILHGSEDTSISVQSSKSVYSRLTGKKRMLILEGAAHKMLYDGVMEKTVFTLIYQAMEGNLI